MQMYEDCLSREYRLEREANEAKLMETEGRRLVKLCIEHGATPGSICKWLREKLNDKC